MIRSGLSWRTRLAARWPRPPGSPMR